MKSILVIALVVVLTIALQPRATGALLAYDGFDYEPVGADVSGLNGGSGFSGAWRTGGFNASQSANYDLGGGSLEHGGLTTLGNRLGTGPVSSIAGLTRDLAQPLGAPGTTRYLSFLVRPEGTLGAGQFNGFFGVLLEWLGEPEIFAGKPGDGELNQFVLENRGGTSQVAAGVAPIVGETSLLVLKSQFTGGADTFSLYVNPSLEVEPLTANAVRTANINTVDGLTIYSTGAFSLDEIRVGETYADVVPVPEPSTAIIAFAGVAILLARRIGGVFLEPRCWPQR